MNLSGSDTASSIVSCSFSDTTWSESDSYYSDSDSYYSDSETALIDSVVGIEILDTEVCIKFCEGHQVSWNTLKHMASKCSRKKIKYYRVVSGNKKYIRFSKEESNPNLYYACPALDSEGVMCGVYFKLEDIVKQIPDPDLKEYLAVTVRTQGDLRLRSHFTVKSNHLEECPNYKCPGGHIGDKSIGYLPSKKSTPSLKSILDIIGKRKYLRFCRDCNDFWCTNCKGTFFSENGVNHCGLTCEKVKEIANASPEEKSSLELIHKVSVTCPGCKFAIALSGGCNKVHCERCDKYFCYLCHDVAYSSYHQCLKHMSAKHGGYFGTVPLKLPKKGLIDEMKALG